MPTTTNKQRLMTHLFSALAKTARQPSAPEQRPVLEQFVYAICREGVTRAQADQAFRSLREQFFDWNEIRVSSSREVAEALDCLPQAEVRAQRIIDFLQEVFETTFSFDLEPLHKKGLKQAEKALLRFRAANDYAVHWVVQQSLGGHAIPVDPPTLRVLQRLGITDDENEESETLHSSLEHQIPKAKGPLFNDLLSTLAEEVCWDDEPNCASCQLGAVCPSYSEYDHRPKPR